jgi:hypothetical protein
LAVVPSHRGGVRIRAAHFRQASRTGIFRPVGRLQRRRSSRMIALFVACLMLAVALAGLTPLAPATPGVWGAPIRSVRVIVTGSAQRVLH